MSASHAANESAGHNQVDNHQGGALRQTTILILLIGATILLHRFVVPPESGFDPAALLAAGFIVLASYTIGHLVEAIKLPHITGYLIAGMVFGPSAASYLPESLQIPPFDKGILNKDVLGQLGILDTLAVALIALSAGGELRIESLRRGFRTIAGILTGQLIFILILVSVFVWAITGGVPAIQLPGTVQLSVAGGLSIGMVVATIAFATSPAATIAVIHDTGAKGNVSRTILSTVVLKDVVVVVLFSLLSLLATRTLGLSGGDGNLWNDLAVHIGGSLLTGMAMGGLFSVYLRYFDRGMLILLVGVIYTTALIAKKAHLDPVLLFMAAGFTVANFSRVGEKLLHSVEKLSLPVYVIFFTLAGANLHLDHLFHVAPFAIGLVLVRVVAIYLGSASGASIGGGDYATRRNAWLGFVSQAGVALSLAGLVRSKFGEIGASIETLIIGGVAVNELIGPVLLKVGLARAGETSAVRDSTSDMVPVANLPVDEVGGNRHLEAWSAKHKSSKKQATHDIEIWGPPANTSGKRINAALEDLREDLKGVVSDLAKGSLAQFRQEVELYMRELRREFLRHYRHLSVRARSEKEAENSSAEHTTSDWNAYLQHETSELTERWRGIVLGRAARIKQQDFRPDSIVDLIDAKVESTPEKLRSRYEDTTFQKQEEDNPLRKFARLALRLRKRLRNFFGMRPLRRTVHLRELARYHISGQVPPKLEGLAALLVQAEGHIAARTGIIFQAILRGYASLEHAATTSTSPDENSQLGRSELISRALASLRKDVEAEISLAFQEIDQIMIDAERRVSGPLGDAFKQLKEDAYVAGTLDLRRSQRRTSTLFKKRVRALQLLSKDLENVRGTSSSAYALLALELEMLGLEARAQDAISEHTQSIEKNIRGRTIVQIERVLQNLEETRRQITEALENASSAESLSEEIRKWAESLCKVAREAVANVEQFRDQMADDHYLNPVLDALGRSASSLTQQYEVSVGRIPRGEWKLPAPGTTIYVPFAELIHAHIETQVAPKLINQTREMATSIEPLSISLHELERRVAFNAEIATGELEVAQEELFSESRKIVRDMVLGALDRNSDILSGHLRSAEGWQSEYPAQTRSIVLGGLQSLRGDFVDGRITQSRIDSLRRAATGKRILHQAEQLPSRLHRIRSQVASTVTNAIGAQKIDDWRHRLGLPLSELSREQSWDKFAAPVSNTNLPLVYERLFAAGTLEAADVLTGREHEIMRARRTLAGESPGSMRTLALVGPDGVGKVSLANAIVRSRTWKNVKRVKLEEATGFEKLREDLSQGVEGKLIIIDGFHWSVDAKPGGFDAVRHLIDRVLETREKSSWLLAVDHLVWSYASQFAPLSEAFPEMIALRPLEPSELESAILARHSLSGYELSFEPITTDTRVDKWIRKAGRAGRPYHAYFRALHAASGGLLRDALRFWLASIERIDEARDFVHIGRVPRSPLAALRLLDTDTLIRLFPVARQGWISVETQAFLFQCSATEAEAQLMQLSHQGLLTALPNHAFRIPAHLRGLLSRVFEERKWT